jgi:hypothetical protein
MRSLLTLPLIVLLASCTRNNHPVRVAQILPIDTIVVFKKEIAKWPNGGVNLFYTSKKQLEDQLHLDNLEAGFDSLQIRIWVDYALGINKELFIIKRDKGVWEGSYYEIIADWYDDGRPDSLRSYKAKEFVPKSNWDVFMNKLISLKIISLPNMNDISGLKDGWTDGVEYMVEISTQKLYRFYTYHSPEHFADKFWQAKNMAEIVEMMEADLKSQ